MNRISRQLQHEFCKNTCIPRDIRILHTKNRLACNWSAPGFDLSHGSPKTSAHSSPSPPKHLFAKFEIPEDQRDVCVPSVAKTWCPWLRNNSQPAIFGPLTLQRTPATTEPFNLIHTCSRHRRTRLPSRCAVAAPRREYPMTKHLWATSAAIILFSIAQPSFANSHATDEAPRRTSDRPAVPFSKCEERLVDAVNDYRDQHGLAPLKVDPTLMKVARCAARITVTVSMASGAGRAATRPASAAGPATTSPMATNRPKTPCKAGPPPMATPARCAASSK